MSGIICTCDVAVKHLGLPGCTDQIGIPKRLIFVPTYTDAGTLNYIDTTTFTFSQVGWDALQYNTDSSARYFPLPLDIESVEMKREESVYNTYPSGLKKFVRDGVRSFMGIYPSIAAPIIGKLKSKGCSKHSVFIIDNNGALVGVEKTIGKLYPMQLSDNSLSAIFDFATDTKNNEVIVKFEFAQNVADEQLSIIPAETIGIDLFTTFNGKIDTNIVQVGTGSTTVIVVDIYTDYGTAKTKIPVEGLVEADVQLYNVTDSAVITKTFVESATVPGRYTITVTAQTNTDIERLSFLTTTAAKPYSDGTWADVQLKHQA
jgi:hypothetical protein